MVFITVFFIGSGTTEYSIFVSLKSPKKFFFREKKYFYKNEFWQIHNLILKKRSLARRTAIKPFKSQKNKHILFLFFDIFHFNYTILMLVFLFFTLKGEYFFLIVLCNAKHQINVDLSVWLYLCIKRKFCCFNLRLCQGRRIISFFQSKKKPSKYEVKLFWNEVASLLLHWRVRFYFIFTFSLLI